MGSEAIALVLYMIDIQINEVVGGLGRGIANSTTNNVH